MNGRKIYIGGCDSVTVKLLDKNTDKLFFKSQRQEGLSSKQCMK